MVTDDDRRFQKLVTVDLHDNAHEAEVVRVLLQTAGIWSHLDNLHASGFAGLGGAVGNIRVQVAESDAEDAQRLVDIHHEARKLRQSGEHPVDAVADDRCLACGEPMLEEEDTCPACGWSWLDDQEDEASELS